MVLAALGGLIVGALWHRRESGERRSVEGPAHRAFLTATPLKELEAAFPRWRLQENAITGQCRVQMRIEASFAERLRHMEEGPLGLGPVRYTDGMIFPTRAQALDYIDFEEAQSAIAQAWGPYMDMDGEELPAVITLPTRT